MKQALVCASFGTTVENGRLDLLSVENALHDVAGNCEFACAVTSRVIRKRLAMRGQMAESLPEVLQRLCDAGYTEVAVQPTHLLYGYEYDKIKAEIAPYNDRFNRLKLGEPLLANTQDLQNVAAALTQSYPRQDVEALVLMGHGTEHFAGVVYPALQSVFALQNRPDVFVATVEGWPLLSQIIPQIQAGGYRKVHLVPLLLVAGDHACHDMAGESPDSWKNQLESLGFTVRCTLEGLGRLPAVQQLYCAKLNKMLE